MGFRVAVPLALTLLFAAGCAAPSLSVGGSAARPKCADQIVAQMATDQTLTGDYNCLDSDTQLMLNMYGEGDDDSVAQLLSQGAGGKVVYVGQAPDGGYLYIVTSPDSNTHQPVSRSVIVHVDKNGKVGKLS